MSKFRIYIHTMAYVTSIFVFEDNIRPLLISCKSAQGLVTPVPRHSKDIRLFMPGRIKIRGSNDGMIVHIRPLIYNAF